MRPSRVGIAAGAIATGVLLLSGCAGDSGGEPTAAIDGAGVRVVESREPAWGDATPWTVVRDPILDLTATGQGSEHEFFRIVDAVWLTGGRLVVGNDGTSEIRFYSADGQFQVAAGGNGDGPGEFRRIRTMSRMRGDSVAVYDVLLNRLTILGPDGSLGRVITLRGAFQRARHLRAYDDSTFLGLASSFAGPPEPGRYRVPYSVVYLGPDGTLLDTLGVIGGTEGYRTPTVDGPLPFAKEGHLATLGSEYVVGDADSLAFARYSRPGVASQSVSVPGYALALTAQAMDSTRQALLRRPDGRAHPPDVMEALESLPIPHHKPGYSRLLLDADGYVWAARFYRGMHPERRVEWEVFAPSGAWMGSIATPMGFHVLRIGSHEILGVQRDELGVEHVQVLGLDRDG